MKKLLFLLFFLPFAVFPADRYWVGGTGNWSDDDNHWATSSGGTPADGNVPTASDNVIFDVLSHTAAYTMTVNATATCLSMTWANPLTGAPTWAGSSGLTISGSLTYVSGMTASYTGTITFNSTSTGKTITTTGVSLASPYSFNGTGGGWTLQDALTTSAFIQLSAGTLNTNGQTVTQTGAGVFSSTGPTTRTLSLGATTWVIASTWTVSGSNMTLTAGTSSITCANTWTPGTYTYYNVTLTQQATILGAGTATYNNFTYSSAGGVYTSISLGGNMTVSGVLTLSGATAATSRLLVNSSAIGTTRTITCNGTVSLTNVDFRDITGAGSASWAGGTSIGDAGGNSGITFAGATTRYWVHGANSSYNAISGGRWSASSGGSVGASDPLPQDNVVFDANSFAATGKTVNMAINGYRIGSMTWTGATNSPTLNMNYTDIHGSLTLDAGMTFIGSVVFGFSGRGSFGITSAGHSSFESIIVAGGTCTLQDNLTTTSTGTITHDYGTLNMNNFNISTTSYDVDGSLARTLTMGSGTFTITGSGSTAWDATPATNFTVTPNTSTIKFTNATSTQKTFAGGGKTYNNIWFTGAGTGEFRLTGSNTFNDFKVDQPPHTVNFTAGTTTTATTWILSGTAGNLTTIGSLTAAGATLAKTGTGLVSADYCSVSYISGSAALKFYFGANSTNGGNTSLVYFTPPPIYVYHTASGGGDYVAATNTVGADFSYFSPAAVATGCSSGPHAQGFTSDGTYDTAEGAFQFSVTPNTGYQLNVTDFAADLRRSTNGPTLWRFAYSTNGSSWTDAGTNVAPGGTSCSNFTNRTWNPTDFTVAAGETLYLRLYAFSASSSSDTGTCRNIVINGTVTVESSGPTNAQKAAFFMFMGN